MSEDNLIPHPDDEATSATLEVKAHPLLPAVQIVMRLPNNPVGRALDVSPAQAKKLAELLWYAAVDVEKRFGKSPGNDGNNN